jgi:hypothetical protein
MVISGQSSSSEEMMIVDDVKSLLLSNIGKLHQTTVSNERLDLASPEERAWMQQGGIDTSSMNERHLGKGVGCFPLLKQEEAASGNSMERHGRNLMRNELMEFKEHESRGLSASKEGKEDENGSGEDVNISKFSKEKSRSSDSSPFPGAQKDEDKGEKNGDDEESSTRTSASPGSAHNQEGEEKTQVEKSATETAASTTVNRPLSSEERRLRERVHECRKHDWNRDMLALVEEGLTPCLVVGMGIAQSHTFLKRFSISRQMWSQFCTLIGEGYLAENPYHNAAHGADVMNSIHYILDFAGLRKARGEHSQFSSAEFFGSLLAGLIHDYKVRYVFWLVFFPFVFVCPFS